MQFLKVLGLIIFGIVLMFIAFTIHPDGNIIIQRQLTEWENDLDEIQDQAPKTAKEISEEQLLRQFNGWTGEHKSLSAAIKANLVNPASWDHVQTRYWIMWDHVVVCTDFRCTNVFGGVVECRIKAKCDLKTGEVLKIIEQSVE